MAETLVRAPVTGEVLRWARESLAIPVEAVSRRLNLPEERILEWEAETERPTLNQLSELARFYHRPSAIFFLPSPPSEPPPPTDFRAVRDPEASALTTKTLLIIRRARRIQQLAAELSDELESPFSPPSGTVKMTRVDPEDLAEQQRRLPGLAVGEQVQIESPYAAFRVWREAVEARDILVLGFPLPSKEVRAFSLADDQVPVIVVNSNDTITARIFSLFHEYAHVLIGHLGLCLPEQHFQRSKRASPTEVFCNHFAGALLVPRSALLAANAQRDPKLADEKFAIRMSRVFHVSRQVIARRMLITDLISKEKHNDLVAQWGWYASPERPPRKSKSGYAQPEHLTCLRRRGTRFASLVMEARQRGLLLDSQVAEYLDIRTGSLDRVEALLASA